MFSFFKSAIEKDLIQLGFGELVRQYKQKLKNKEFTKQQFYAALKELHNKHQSKLSNIKNVNVATRQTFDDDEILVPLNLQNIQQEFIDYDYLYSTLLFEFNNNNRIHTKALQQLDKLLHENYPDAVIEPTDKEKVNQLSLKELINDATLPFSQAHKNYLKAVFHQLKMHH